MFCYFLLSLSAIDPINFVVVSGRLCYKFCGLSVKLSQPGSCHASPPDTCVCVGVGPRLPSAVHRRRTWSCQPGKMALASFYTTLRGALLWGVTHLQAMGKHTYIALVFQPMVTIQAKSNGYFVRCSHVSIEKWNKRPIRKFGQL